MTDVWRCQCPWQCDDGESCWEDGTGDDHLCADCRPSAECAWSEQARKSPHWTPPCDSIAMYLVHFRGGVHEATVCAGHVAWLRPLRPDIESIRSLSRAGEMVSAR